VPLSWHRKAAYFTILKKLQRNVTTGPCAVERVPSRNYLAKNNLGDGTLSPPVGGGGRSPAAAEKFISFLTTYSLALFFFFPWMASEAVKSVTIG